MRCASVLANALAPFSSYSIFAQTQCRRIVSSLNSSSSLLLLLSSSFLGGNRAESHFEKSSRHSTEKISELFETFGYTEFAQVNVTMPSKGTDQEEEISTPETPKGTSGNGRSNGCLITYSYILAKTFL